MKTMLKPMIPYWIADLVLFYGLPFLIRDTGSAMFLLLLLMPLGCVLTGGLYGVSRGFHFVYGLTVALLFLPSVFLFYNETAVVYSLVFGVLALVGNAAGASIYKMANKERPRFPDPAEDSPAPEEE